jgi:GDP-L-fucose synthase
MNGDPLIFVAGHRGMVGSALLRGLGKRGHQRLLTRGRQELDLCDAGAVDRFFAENRPDWVMIAAAKVGGIVANNSFPADFIRENLQIQVNLIDAAHRYQAERVLFLGSSCIYPRMASQPLLESSLLTGPLEPTNRAYALAKIAGIEMCWSYNRQYGKDSRTGYLAAMPTNLYGTGDNYHPTHSHVIPGLLRRFHEAKVKRVGEVVVWGSGVPRREFMHADDMAAACIHLISLPEPTWQSLLARDRHDGEAPLVNIGVGYDVTIESLATTIAEVVGFQGNIQFDPSKPDGTPRKLMSSAKLHALFPEGKPRGLREGLEQTYVEFCAINDREH